MKSTLFAALLTALVIPASSTALTQPPVRSMPVPHRAMFAGGSFTTTVHVIQPALVRVHVSATVWVIRAGSIGITVNGCTEPRGFICDTVERGHGWNVKTGFRRIGWTIVISAQKAFHEVGAALFDNSLGGDITSTTTTF